MKVAFVLSVFTVIVARAEIAENASSQERSWKNDAYCNHPEIEGASGLAGTLCTNFPSLLSPSSSVNWRSISSPSSSQREDLPPYFFWGDIHGVDYLTPVRNQHIPKHCGSCWAFGTLASISDRINILRRRQFPEINLSPQVLIDNNGGGTCNGGNVDGVYRYLVEEGLPDETCETYKAENSQESSHSTCQSCTNRKGEGEQCEATGDFFLFKISDFDSTDDSDYPSYRTMYRSNTEKIMNEIYNYGPVACTMFASQKFEEYTGGIYLEQGMRWHPNHVVSLVGWGTDPSGIEYWIGRNSWGSYWGENGFFRIIRNNGRMNLGIENGCTWARPVIPQSLLPKDPLPNNVPYGAYLTDLHDPRRRPPDNDGQTFDDFSQANNRKALNRHGSRHSYRDTTVKKFVQDVYDIRDRNGISYASINRNQNSPNYCESSWAQAAVSALNDRLSILKNGAYPQVALSTQVLMNCATSGSDGCSGGNIADAYKYIKEKGIPDESCSPYEAKSNECTEIQTCKVCWSDECYALHSGEYQNYRISDYGMVSGEAEVMNQILANGPVACRICDSDSFESYRGGIFSAESPCSKSDLSKKHVVLSGWGEENGVQFWIGRNSWGTAWGENGWFKVRKGFNDLGITQECYWATPVDMGPLTSRSYLPPRESGITRIKKQYRSERSSYASEQGAT